MFLTSIGLLLNNAQVDFDFCRLDTEFCTLPLSYVGFILNIAQVVSTSIGLILNSAQVVLDFCRLGAKYHTGCFLLLEV